MTAVIVWYWECCNDSFLPASRRKLSWARGFGGSNPASKGLREHQGKLPGPRSKRPIAGIREWTLAEYVAFVVQKDRRDRRKPEAENPRKCLSYSLSAMDC